MTRRDILETALAGKERTGGISLPTPKIRSRDWDQKHPTRSYRGIPEELHANIVQLAEEYKVPVGEIVHAFLVYALQAHQSGDLKINPTFVPGKFTLFPDDPR